MIIEIECYKYDTKLSGKTIEVSDLKRKIQQAEETYDRENDNFERVLCSLIQYEIVETDEQPDYVYNRDVGKLFVARK